MQVAKIIHQQLGGKIIPMIGAYNLTHGENKFQFRFKGSRAANCCVITLDPDDTYSVEFFKIGKGVNVRSVKQLSMVYGDQLKEVFEDFTKLRLTLY